MKKLLMISLFVFEALALMGCALSGFLSPKEVEMFVVDQDSEVVVQLPSELAKAKFADDIFIHRCWNSELCVIIYHYDKASDSGFEYVNFWYT